MAPQVLFSLTQATTLFDTGTWIKWDFARLVRDCHTVKETPPIPIPHSSRVLSPWEGRWKQAQAHLEVYTDRTACLRATSLHPPITCCRFPWSKEPCHYHTHIFRKKCFFKIFPKHFNIVSFKFCKSLK